MPVGVSAQNGVTVFLVVGVSPRRKIDRDYYRFFELVASHVASISASAKAYEEERRRAEALAELDRAKTTFFSNVSHELRTPLTLILAPLEDEIRESTQPRERLEIAHRNSLRLLKLVNTLLEFSRIEAGRVEASFEPTDLAAYTADLAAIFRSRFERVGLRLRVECPPLSEPVFVDRDMWEKVIFNLLSNAYKFTFEGEVEIKLNEVNAPESAGPTNQDKRHEAPEIATWVSPQRWVRLSVRDTGTGIPAAELPRIFQRFHRVRQGWARSHEGTGIGLALVQELIRLHGGQVQVESGEGVGTTFLVSVPMGSAHVPKHRTQSQEGAGRTGRGMALLEDELAWWIPEHQEWANHSERPAREENHPHRPALDLTSNEKSDALPPPTRAIRPGDNRPIASSQRILLAEDNRDLREYMQRLLASRGYEVIAVPDGRMALEEARARLPALVLSDVMMPRLDGFALLREFRSEPALLGVPIILLSARAGEEARIEGAEAGADDYLTKPFNARELLARVASHLEFARVRRNAEREIEQREERLRVALIAQKESEEKARVALDSITDGLSVIDAVGQISYFNSAARRLLSEHGQDTEALLGRNFFEVFPRTLGEAGERSLQRTLVEGVATEVESFCGAWQRWFRVRNYPTAEGGVSTFFQDVTERKRSEEREQSLTAEAVAATAKFRAVFEQSSVFAGIMTLEGRIQEANRLCLDACGYRSDEVLGKLFWECPWWRSSKEVQEKIRAGAATAARGTVYSEVLPYHWADGTERRVDFALYPIRDDAGRVLFLHPTGIDVTERLQAQARTEFLSQLTQKLSTVSDPQEINRIATREVGLFLGVHRCCFLQAIPHTEKVRIWPDWHPDDEPGLGGSYELSQFGDPKMWPALQFGPIVIDDVRFHPLTKNFRSSYERVHVLAYLLAPFTRERRWVASLGVSATQPRRWTETEKLVLEHAVARVWPLIERARAEEELRENKTRFDLVKDAAQVGFWFCDLPFDRLSWDPLVKAHFWLPSDAEVTIDTFYERLHSEDRERTRAAIAKSILGRTRYEVEYRTVSDEGAEKWIRAMGRTFYGVDGQPKSFDGVTLDITERKRAEDGLRESEQRFRLIADAAPVLIWMSGNDKLYNYLNRGWLDFVGRSMERELGNGWRENLHFEDADRCGHLYATSFDARRPFEMEYRVRHHSGEYRWVLARGVPRFAPGGTFEGYIGGCVDIHDQKLAEDALRQANGLLGDKAAHLETLVQQRTAKLSETIGELEAFSYSIAHDMRAPLRSLRGYSEILLEEFAQGLPSDGQEYLHRIARSAGRMDKLIQDVLDYSRVVRDVLPSEPVDLEQLLHGIAETYPMFAPEKVDLVFVGSFPTVLGSEAMLTQVVSNLLGNAVKFVAPGVKPQIRVWAESHSHRVRLFVKDNGVGIESDQHAKIFAIFQRVDKSYEGTGIGLAIVKRGVERMGGSVGIESALGQGSTFWIELARA